MGPARKKSGPRTNKPQYTAKLRLRVGDMVRVITGKDKGKEGKISQLAPSTGKVVIEGINLIVKHERPRQNAAGAAAQGGGRITKAAPIAACKVQLIDPSNSDRVTRIGIKVNADGSRTRIARKSGGKIDNG